MPENFTAFNASNRLPNTVFQSSTYTIPADSTDNTVEFTLTNMDIVNEPETTVIYWTIERNDGTGWRHLCSGDLNGLGGATPRVPPGRVGVSIKDIKGQDIRGTLRFTNAGDQRMRFGVDGATF